MDFERITGPVGSALDITHLYGEDSPVVSRWWLHFPHMAPNEWWVCMVAHLRPTEHDLAEPWVTTTRATHQLLITGLDPTLDPHVDDPDTWSLMVPPPVEIQFEVPDDDEAEVVGRLSATALVEGAISPFDPEGWQQGIHRYCSQVHNPIPTHQRANRFN
jgi:hypothetical protein